MSRVAYGSHLVRGFSEELIRAVLSTTLDLRFLQPGEVLQTPESETWLAIVQDQFLDSGGPDEFDGGTLDRLIFDARRAIVFACPPVEGTAWLAIQSGLAGGGALFVMTEASRIFLWVGRLRQAGDYQPAITVWHRPPK